MMLRYWQYGCPDNAEVRKVDVIELGDTPKERRRKGKVYRWEVDCKDKGVLRCSSGAVATRCDWVGR